MSEKGRFRCTGMTGGPARERALQRQRPHGSFPVSTDSYQLVVNLDKVGFLDSTGLGVLVGGLRRVRAHDGSLDLVCRGSGS